MNLRISNMIETRKGFTLVELLVVVSIIALLIALLLPSLGRARQSALSTACTANLRAIGQGLVAYNTENKGWNVPSFNMTGFNPGYEAGPGEPMDGWAAILDRDGEVPASDGPTKNVFYCPCTENIAIGANSEQTGNYPQDQQYAQGYQDWPCVNLSLGGDNVPSEPTTIPQAGFVRNIRCSYWLNAYNPIGSPAIVTVPLPCPYYTQSVGYTAADGTVMWATKITEVARPSALIVAADGVYMGRQSVTELNENNCRIGYRHPGSLGDNSAANAVFADGHAETIQSANFPNAPYPATVQSLGQINRYTLYLNQ